VSGTRPLARATRSDRLHHRLSGQPCWPLRKVTRGHRRLVFHGGRPEAAAGSSGLSGAGALEGGPQIPAGPAFGCARPSHRNGRGLIPRGPWPIPTIPTSTSGSESAHGATPVVGKPAALCASGGSSKGLRRGFFYRDRLDAHPCRPRLDARSNSWSISGGGSANEAYPFSILAWFLSQGYGPNIGRGDWPGQDQLAALD